jgi:Tat protein secretion system quality control protein TatD with DNase activity
LELIPPNLVLTETDYPHSRKRDPYASQPGAVRTIEDALMAEWETSRFELRHRLWRNVAAIFDRCGLLEELPLAVQETILAVGID